MLVETLCNEFLERITLLVWDCWLDRMQAACIQTLFFPEFDGSRRSWWLHHGWRCSVTVSPLGIARMFVLVLFGFLCIFGKKHSRCFVGIPPYWKTVPSSRRGQ